LRKKEVVSLTPPKNPIVLNLCIVTQLLDTLTSAARS
jgi:hypothetical protein